VSRDQHRTVLKVQLSDYPLRASSDLLGEYPLLKSPPVMRPARRHRPFGMSAYRRSPFRRAISHRRRVVCATLLAAAAIVGISLSAVIADPIGVVIARLRQAWRPAPAFRVESNAAVLAAMNQFARKPFFAEALARGAPHLPYIRAIFADEQLPEELAYIGLVESEFRPEAISSTKARGVWQFMPMTGQRFGLQQDGWVDERSDTRKATRAAARYLKFLHNIFGDWNLALAAYNAGEGRVQAAIKRQGVRDFWRLAEAGALPRETIRYVPRVYAAITIASDPEAHGVRLPDLYAGLPDIVHVETTTDLALVARCSRSTIGDLLKLNPMLQRKATPAGQPFDLRVPHGTAAAVEACIAQLPESARTRVHVVGNGQTLSGVATLYGRRPHDIAEVNALYPHQPLQRGSELIIPAR
jgi:hypothetical protein